MSNLHKVTFLNDLIDHLAHNHLGHSLLYFFAPWAEQCKTMDGVVQELAKLHPEWHFWRIPAEDFPELAVRYSVKAVPCFVAIGPEGRIGERVEGAKPAELTRVLGKASMSAGNSTAAGESLDDKCLRLTRQRPVMLFIKGTPEEPRCGFTAQLLTLLKKEGIRQFGYFNILTDESVRQHLKDISQWPTFPQIYWKGELLGGLDILKEMAEGGQLEEIKRECA